MAGLFWAAAATCFGQFERWVIVMGNPYYVIPEGWVERESLPAAIGVVIGYVIWWLVSISACVLGMSAVVRSRTEPPITSLLSSTIAVVRLLVQRPAEAGVLLFAPMMTKAWVLVLGIAWWGAMVLCLMLLGPILDEPSLAFNLTTLFSTLLALSGPLVIVEVVLPAMNSRYMLLLLSTGNREEREGEREIAGV